MKGEAIPDSDHVLRYVGGRHLDLDSDGQPIALGSGFISRPHERNSPSCNWLELLRGHLEDQVQQVRNAARVRYGATGRLARLNVGTITRVVAEGTQDGRAVTVVYDPLDAEGEWAADPSHALMTNVPDADDPEGELVGDLIANCVLESFPARPPVAAEPHHARTEAFP